MTGCPWYVALIVAWSIQVEGFAAFAIEFDVSTSSIVNSRFWTAFENAIVVVGVV